MKKSISYEAPYFTGQFQRSVGNFTPKDLQQSIDWFTGWLGLVNSMVDITHGRDKTALEIGSSIGGVCNILSDWGYDVTGVDISTYAIERARKLSKHITYHVADIQAGIPGRRRFDLVIAFEVMEHLHHPEKALSHIYKRMRPGGIVILSMPYPHSWHFKDPTHVNVKHPDEWKSLLKQTGFVDITYKAFTMVPFFYRFHPALHFTLPFMVPLPFINNPNFFVGHKKKSN